MRFQNATTIFKYEHLPLLWAVVNHNNTNISSVDKTYIEGLLNEAPACGPNKTDNGFVTYRNFNWSTASRLVWPEHLGGRNTESLGEFNGLDYMLLHNLYWLANMMTYPSSIDYDPGIQLSNNIIATYQVACSKALPADKSVNLLAGNNIQFRTGFSFTSGSGSVLKADIYKPDNGGAFFFKQVSISDYETCQSNLKSAKFNAYDSVDLVNMQDVIAEVFPNPCNDAITVSVSNVEIKQVEIINTANLLIRQMLDVSGNAITIDVSTLSPGVYIIRIFTNKKDILTKKIIKT
jgi:hypothetical protein